MNSVVHFEVPADDMDRAKKFYSEVFGWKMTDLPEMDYVTVETGETDEKHMLKKPGMINGGMMKRTGTAESPVIVMGTDDLERDLKKVEEAGGKAVTDIQKVGDMGLYARVKDTEGNIIGIFQPLRGM